VGQLNRFLASVMSVCVVAMLTGIDASAASVPAAASHKAIPGHSVSPKAMKFSGRPRRPLSRPRIKKPLLTRNPAALKAAKTRAAHGAASLAGPSAGSAQAPTAPGAGTPALAGPVGSTLETLTSFPAMGLEQQVADMGRDQVDEPSDTQIAAGPGAVAEAVNGNLSVWTKSGARIGTEDLALFFNVASNESPTDPNLLYDAPSGRWFMSIMALDASNDSTVDVAVSQTSDPTGVWYIYTVLSQTAVIQDQPSLGTSDDKVTVAFTDYGLPCNPLCSFLGQEVWVLQKSDLLAGVASTPWSLLGVDSSRFGVMPIRNLGATPNAYLVYNDADAVALAENQGFPTLAVMQVTGTPNAHNLTFSEIHPPTTESRPPPSAVQPGGAPALQTDDDRVETAVMENGVSWVGWTESCGTNPDGSCLRIFKLNIIESPFSSSTIATTIAAGSASDFLYYPAIGLDNSGNPFITYTHSSVSIYPSLVARLQDGTTTTLAAGGSAFDSTVCGGTNRWGDYASAAQDPANPSDVWIAGGYQAAGSDPCDWRTAAARLTLTAPTISGFTPTQGPMSGGNQIAITGSGYVPGATQVSVAGNAATNVVVESPDQVVATVPNLAGAGVPAHIQVTTADGSANSTATYHQSPWLFAPSPIALNGTLAASQTVAIAVTPNPGQPTYLSFTGVGSACVVAGATCTALTTVPTSYSPAANGEIQLHYSAPAAVPISGMDAVHVQDTATNPTTALDDTYTFTPVVTKLAFAFPPIAPTGDLVAGMSAAVTLTASDATNQPVPNTTIFLSFQPAAGGGTASIDNMTLGTSASAFTTDGRGQISVVYTTPGTLPVASRTDDIHATASNGSVTADDGYTYPPVTTFYFAEGFTAGGFKEILSLLMPNESGTLRIDFYTQTSHGTGYAFLTAGVVEPVDINTAVGPNQEVSLKVSFPGPGIAERMLHFSFGSWHGSTDVVGTNAPSTTWNFAEGSTLSFFSEYLTLQNPNSASVNVQLNYFTTALQPARLLVLPPNSRTTVEVFSGSPGGGGPTPCIPSGAGANCGVGPGIVGVSTQIVASQPIIAERPFYVNNFSFGSGSIRDGHDAFGATAPSTQWYLAEGTTITGFNEYLTLLNSQPTATSATIKYFTDIPSVITKTVTLPPTSRTTIEVFSGNRNDITNCTAGSGGDCGVGGGIGGVSTQITANQAIVVERPIYMVHNFGSGAVAGAHDVGGASALNTVFGFSAASTTAGANDYLTIENPQTAAANITITYFTDNGTILRQLQVAPQSRHTVEVFNATDGAGPGLYPLGIVVQSTPNMGSTYFINVEKPTYDSNSNTYGATDTLGYSPSGFGF
jgi:IPT/TIG domain-containing protein/uncharacterized protein DUF5719